MDDVNISARLSAQQRDIRNFFVSSERSLSDLNDTLWCAIFVVQAFEFDFIYKKVNSYLCYFLLKIVNFIGFSTYLFDNITSWINIPNVTLSNISHLVYSITHFGETDEWHYEG